MFYGFRCLVLILALLGLSGCKSTGEIQPDQTPNHPIISQCNILNTKGELLWSYPSWLCVFFPNGNFLSGGNEEPLTLRESDRKVLWTTTLIPHHMISIAKNGDILTLTSEWKKVSAQRP